MAKFTIKQPSGQSVVVEAPSQEAALDQVLNASGPDVSAFGSFGRGAAGTIPLGEQAYAGIAGLAEHKPYTQERQEFNQLTAADKEQNPGARLAGQAAGVVAPIALTAGVAAPETLLGAAGQGALFGGAYGAGNAVDTLAGGGSGVDAAKDLALGAGTGAIGGVAGHELGSLLGGLGRKAAVSAVRVGDATEPLGTKAATEIAEHAPLSAEDLVAIGKGEKPSPASPLGSSVASLPIKPQMPETIQAKQGFFPSAEELKAEILAGNLGGSPRQLRALPGKDPIATLNHMSDVIKANSTPDNPLIGMTDRYSERLNKFVKLHDSVGAKIGQEFEKVNAAPLPIQPIQEGLINSAKFLNPSDQAQLQSVVEQVGKYAKLDGTPDAISFKRLQQLKSDLGGPAFEGKGNDVLKGAYHTIDSVQDSALQSLGPAFNKPEFTKLKEAYQMTSRAIPMLRMATTRSLAKGYSAFGAPLAALVTGHPIAALGAALKEPLERAAGAVAFGAPAEVGETLAKVPSVLGSQAAKSVPSLATKASTDLNLQHPAMAPWRQVFAQNASKAKDPGEIAKANAVTDFTLSQRDPAYAKAKQTASESPETGPEPQKMAEGGLVSNEPEAMGNLEGLQRTANEIAKPTVPMEPTTPVRTAAPKDGMHQSFNSQFEDQLKAYLLKSKGEDDAQ